MMQRKRNVWMWAHGIHGRKTKYCIGYFTVGSGTASVNSRLARMLSTHSSSMARQML